MRRLTRPLIAGTLIAVACASGTSAALAAPARTAARAPAAGGPETVVTAYVDALRAQDWAKAAGLLHPDALGEARTVLLALSATDPSGEIGRQFFTLKEGETVEGLPPQDLFARFMATLVAQTQGLAELLASTRADSLGAVREGELTHVVYRMTRAAGAEEPFSQVEVLTVKKSGADWRTLLPPEIQGILGSIRNSIAQREAMRQPQEPFPQLDLAPGPDTNEAPQAPAPPPPPAPEPPPSPAPRS
jgi:hypothetical protein